MSAENVTVVEQPLKVDHRNGLVVLRIGTAADMELDPAMACRLAVLLVQHAEEAAQQVGAVSTGSVVTLPAEEP